MRYLSINKNQATTLSSCLLVLAIGLNQNCLAQQSNVTRAGVTQPAKAASAEDTLKALNALRKQQEKGLGKPPGDTFGKSEPLTADKAKFDDIPDYTGKAKLATGTIYQPGGAGTALMICTYNVNEPKSQVKDWYTNALRMYGWNITFQSESVINAVNSKSGNTCFLQFCDEDKTRKGKSLLQIDYHRAAH